MLGDRDKMVSLDETVAVYKSLPNAEMCVLPNTPHPLEQADTGLLTLMAYSMITVYGMNDKIGNISFYDPTQENTFTKPYSEETGKIIDEEVRKLIEVAYERTKALLTERKVEVEKLAKELLTKEVLFQSDVETLIGKRPFEEKKLLDDSQNGTEEHHTGKGAVSEGVPPYDSGVSVPAMKTEEA